MFTVSEEVTFCYGHRLMDYVGRCARIHGHNARVELVLGSATLDRRGFVMDFGDLEEVAKRFLDETLDHRLLLRRDDPVIPSLTAAGEVFVALDENPTAEFLARFIFEALTQKGIPLKAIRFWETATSVATYEP
ncbi:MAG: 6-carboxytetrahydropterin synthase [Deltaproteobacteria bacterium]|nr:6-carboxytetrahydropterin synthase [Myxococcales bacterium]MDP3217989.1 6-carboxytetrahydropterin synthase [Deltaproteobacteria bacterium]